MMANQHADQEQPLVTRRDRFRQLARILRWAGMSGGDDQLILTYRDVLSAAMASTLARAS